MSRGQKSKELLDACSRCGHIGLFSPKTVSYDQGDDSVQATFKQQQGLSWEGDNFDSGLIRSFPIIYRDSGEPWDLGNLYLVWKFNELAKYDKPTISTLDSIAKRLTMFLRWIEHNQKKGSQVHELYFPDNALERVTYRYHRYLKSLLRQRPQPISLQVAKSRMQSVINFYDGLVNGGLIGESELENIPFESRIAGLPITNAIGYTYIKEVKTTDISFKVPVREDSNGLLVDGGKLRPLSDNEQETLLEALASHENRVFQLMCWFSIFTGARLQTTGTLRISDIKNLLDQKLNAAGECRLKVGTGTNVDIKLAKRSGQRYLIHVPQKLISYLVQYSESEEAKARRENSFYGDSDENYLFLNADGRPFYTSQTELSDRANPKYNHRLAVKDRVDFPIADGKAVSNIVSRINKKIKSTNPDWESFRFHDLRATYGMNYVRDQLKANVSPDNILQNLKSRMGHRNIATTLNYLKYDQLTEQVDNLSTHHYSRIDSLDGAQGE